MQFAQHLVVVRGGGDLATGVVARLHRSGFPIVVLELARPLTVRRTVAVSSAVAAGAVQVEDVVARRVATSGEAVAVAAAGVVAVLVAPELGRFEPPPEVVVDARLAKRNIDTMRTQAPLVVGLGPGFTAGDDCDAVVETMRGHHLGRVIWNGPAAADTRIPGSVGGESELRVLRAEAAGPVSWEVDFGDHVVHGQAIGTAGGRSVVTLTNGVIRGLIAEGTEATPGLKIGDVDPRADASACWEISDKALAVGGGVLEAVLTHLNRSA